MSTFGLDHSRQLVYLKKKRSKLATVHMTRTPTTSQQLRQCMRSDLESALRSDCSLLCLDRELLFLVWQLLHACLAPHPLLTGSTCVQRDGPRCIRRTHTLRGPQHRRKCAPRHTPQTDSETHTHTLTKPLALVAQRECGGLVWLY